MNQELKALLDDHQIYHSELQMDSFITLQIGGTTYGQYKQALRELFRRYRGLKQLHSERVLLEIDIEELGQPVGDEFERRRNAIKAKTKQLDMEDLERNLADTEREFAHFFRQAQALKAVVGELTPQRRQELEEELWLYRAKFASALDALTFGRPQRQTMEMVRALPAGIRQKLAGISAKGLAEWFAKGATPLPELQPGETTVQNLLGD